jgi:hypothetical protein
MTTPTTAAGRNLAEGIADVCDRHPTATRRIAAIEAEARASGVDGCIAIVQQSLDAVRAEDDGESRLIKTSIAARAHILSMLEGYRAALIEEARNG